MKRGYELVVQRFQLRHRQLPGQADTGSVYRSLPFICVVSALPNKISQECEIRASGKARWMTKKAGRLSPLTYGLRALLHHQSTLCEWCCCENNSLKLYSEIVFYYGFIKGFICY